MSLTKATYAMVDGAPTNVKDFGAIGDGIADDTSAIQTAINTGSSIFFPSGTYSITSSLIPKNNKVIFGDGGAVIKCSGDFFAFEHNNLASPLLRCTIKGLKFIGDSTYQGIFINYQFQGCVLEDLEFQGDCRNPIYLTGQQWGLPVISNIRVRRVTGTKISTDYGILVENVASVSNVDIIGQYAKGIYVLNGVNVLIQGGNVAGSGAFTMDEAISIKNSKFVHVDSVYTEVLNNFGGANYLKRGVYVEDSSNILIENFTQEDGSSWVVDTAATCSDIKFVNCDFEETLVNNSGNIVVAENCVMGASPATYGLFSDLGGYVRPENAPQIVNSNWELSSSVPYSVSATNAGLVTLSVDTSVFLFGDRSQKAVVTASSQGIIITVPNVVANKLYTFAYVAKSDQELRVTNYSNTTVQNQRNYQDLGNWNTAFATVQSSTTTLEIRILITSAGTFYIDTMQLHPVADNLINVYP